MSSKTFSKRRYQPVAEFDDVTLARKREYWRSKKREQRARKSSTQKKIGNENLGLCMSVVSDEPFLQIHKVNSDPSLHNHDISCKLEETDAVRNSSSSGQSVSECNVTMVPCEKERWLQKTELKHVLPKFPEICTNYLKGVTGNTKLRSSVTGSSNTNTLDAELHPNSSHAHKTKTRIFSINVKRLPTSPQSHASMVLPVHNNQNKPKNCLRHLTSAECKVHIRTAKRRTCAIASKNNTRVALTEEEIAAKRRENWRIKKREQRAKRALKLARNREGGLGQGQSSCIVNASSDNSKALRGINLNSVNSKCSLRTTLHVQDTKPNRTSSSSTTQTLKKSKMLQFAQSQKRRCHKPTRNSFLGASKVESPEDRHARQKEYWRIKKREQRAAKARLKEQGTLKHHGRRYHNSSNQMCGVQVSRADAFTSCSDTIGGFIKEDGTVTFSTSKTTTDSSLPPSHNFSNVKCIDKVGLQVQVSLPLDYSDAQPVKKLVFTSCNVSKAHQNSLVKSILDKEVKTERACRAACLRSGLLRSNVSVLKQRKQNKKSNKRDSITSSITKTVCDSSTSTRTPKKEPIEPPIHAVFSIPEITPFNSVEDGKPSPCLSSESHFEPPAAVNHHATTLQAVASMKKLLEESVCSQEDTNNTEIHFKCANQPLQLTNDDLKSENAQPNITLQPNVLECDISENTSLKDIELSPRAIISEDTSHKKPHNFCQEAADGRHAFSPVAVQPQCRNTEKFSDDGADPKQSCPSQVSQKQHLGESDELQRKREYWRLMKRQQRARNANRGAAKNVILHNLAPQKKTPSTPLLLATGSTCRQIAIQKKTRRCTKPAGPQTQSTDKSRANRSQIVAMPNPQDDPLEVIRRRRMQWRIKKQEQRARKAANERKLRQQTLPPQGQASGQKNTSFRSVVQSKKSEDQLGCLAKPCQTTFKEESPNYAMEGPLSQAEWRNLYLMDPDPVSLMLVCMVCGEQLYWEGVYSLEGVKAHIEEVHPNTQSLGDLERQGILDAWDKQVAVREHFITHRFKQ